MYRAEIQLNLSLSERKSLSSFSKLHETLVNSRVGSSFSSEVEWSDELSSELRRQGMVERKQNPGLVE